MKSDYLAAAVSAVPHWAGQNLSISQLKEGSQAWVVEADEHPYKVVVKVEDKHHGLFDIYYQGIERKVGGSLQVKFCQHLSFIKAEFELNLIG